MLDMSNINDNHVIHVLDVSTLLSTDFTCVQSNWGKDWLPGTASGLPSLAASRHLYERVLRKFALGISNLHVQTGAIVDGMLYDAHQERVTGMSCFFSAGQQPVTKVTTSALGLHVSCCSSAFMLCLVHLNCDS